MESRAVAIAWYSSTVAAGREPSAADQLLIVSRVRASGRAQVRRARRPHHACLEDRRPGRARAPRCSTSPRARSALAACSTARARSGRVPSVPSPRSTPREAGTGRRRCRSRERAGTAFGSASRGPVRALTSRGRPGALTGPERWAEQDRSRARRRELGSRWERQRAGQRMCRIVGPCHRGCTGPATSSRRSPTESE